MSYEHLLSKLMPIIMNIFILELNVKTKERGVVVMENHSSFTTVRRVMARILFNYLHVPAVSFLNGSAAILYTTMLRCVSLWTAYSSPR